MSRLHAILLLLFALTATARATELGRLFYTPQERQQLEHRSAAPGNTGDNIPSGSVIVVNGVIQKQGGNRIVWINGAAQTAGRGNDKTPASVPVNVPGKSRPVELKVGQRLLVDQPAPEKNP